MRQIEIQFPDQVARAVFPIERKQIPLALEALGLSSGHPVIVLIGGMIDENFDLTRDALQSIAVLAQEIGAVVVSGGTKMGIMSLMGEIRTQNNFEFPLLGITVESVITWPGGPKSSKFLWWGNTRWPLDQNYTHFILTPGMKYGDESPWIVEAASILSRDDHSVTVLLNGGKISRLDIKLSLDAGRRVIALQGTGRYADELAEDPDRHELVQIVSVEDKYALIGALRTSMN